MTTSTPIPPCPKCKSGYVFGTAADGSGTCQPCDCWYGQKLAAEEAERTRYRGPPPDSSSGGNSP